MDIFYAFTSFTQIIFFQMFLNGCFLLLDKHRMCLMWSVNSSALSAFQQTPFPTILPPKSYLCVYLNDKYPGFQHVHYFEIRSKSQRAALIAASVLSNLVIIPYSTYCTVFNEHFTMVHHISQENCILITCTMFFSFQTGLLNLAQ